MYKVKGITIESQQASQYGPDIEAELTKMISEELAKQIDKEILQALLNAKIQNNYNNTCKMGFN